MASFAAGNAAEGSYINLLNILEFENIRLHIDDYGDHFDGALVFDNSIHIHLNSNLGNRLDSKRGRFTLAHELGHYIIPHHHEAIKMGEVNFSTITFNQHNYFEREADYFAASILMPTALFKRFCEGRPFGIELIRLLSNTFDASILSVLKRYCEIGNHEIMVIACQNGKLVWYEKSKDFPAYKHRFSIGNTPPLDSFMNEYILGNKSESELSHSYSGDWFYTNFERPMREYCLYYQKFRHILSVLWFD
ncbi:MULTISPECIES: ImmA/IrrE family metallo-endopeptidase [unclassified Lewinella]|uniref:ImmA/IrrE family metallo-endopeptidase n=1 Tax=unclassified Lewinella TaxID=2637037 RepID=UPI001300AE2C|nr:MULTISPECIES: ImmA/IrrE family metallo-endopeptidase [unclassified Lewinella]